MKRSLSFVALAITLALLTGSVTSPIGAALIRLPTSGHLGNKGELPVVAASSRNSSFSAIATPHVNGSDNYYYNSMYQQVSFATGASASFTVAKPSVGVNDLHSITELAIATIDHKQSIEAGWTVDKALNGDASPHLFVYSTVDGLGNNWNRDFVSNNQSLINTTTHRGAAIPIGQVATFNIQFLTNPARWRIMYNGVSLGYFPQSLWGGTRFKQFTEVQAYGEVDSTSATTPHSQMGNGIAGNKPNSAVIRGVKLFRGTPPAVFTPANVFKYFDQPAANAAYTLVPMPASCKTNCGMNFGGPGL